MVLIGALKVVNKTLKLILCRCSNKWWPCWFCKLGTVVMLAVVVVTMIMVTVVKGAGPWETVGEDLGDGDCVGGDRDGEKGCGSGDGDWRPEKPVLGENLVTCASLRQRLRPAGTKGHQSPRFCRLFVIFLYFGVRHQVIMKMRQPCLDQKIIQK